METKPTRIFLVEDDADQVGLIRKMLSRKGNGTFAIEWITHLSLALDRLAQRDIDVVLLDLGLPDSKGLDTFVRAYAQCPNLPFIILTGLADEALGLAAMRQGAQDYLIKGDFNGALLARAIRYAIERRRFQEDLLADEQILEDIFNSIQDGLSILDLDRNVIRVNPAMRKFPITEPILGRKCFEVYHGRSQICKPCPVEHTIATGQANCGLIDAFDEHGEKRIGEIYSYPLINHATGQVQGVIEYVRDVTERIKLEEALKDSEKKLRYLTSQLLMAQEDERRRLSQGLHDELGHALLAMKLDLRALKKQLLPEQTGLAENIKELLCYTDELIEDVRRLYLDLTPGDLEDLGLTAALQNLCDEFGRHYEKISWSVSLENIDALFSIRVQTAIYRIFQELLTNIGKHADPTKVSVAVAQRADHVFFEVKDNGRGFDMQTGWLSSRKAGMGLLAMEERVRMLGGDLQLWSRKNQGTEITFVIPVIEGEK